MVRLVLADDVPEVREVLRTYLTLPPHRFTVVGEAGDGPDALQCITDLSPDVAILDVRMPGLTGLEVVQAMRERGLETPVILCSGEPDLPEQLPHGVVARLSKPIRLDLLTQAIEDAVTVHLEARRA